MSEVVNVEQFAAWDGEEGAGWAEHWDRYDRAISCYREPLAAAAAVADGERVTDIGCGNGESTRDAARATPAGSVLGVDLSGPMLARARDLAAAEGLANLEFLQADAQVHPFGEMSFDLAMSRFGSMFFADKVAAFGNIGSSLRPGGRLLLLVWQALGENEQFQMAFDTLGAGRDLPTPPPGAPSPFGLADVGIGRSCLEAAGFVDVVHESMRGTFTMGSDAEDAYGFMSETGIARGLLAGLDDEARDRALGALRGAIEDHATPDGVQFSSATWLITARRP